jgi:GT2 family glycosyltransferase
VTAVGCVVIGRNEAPRLRTSLESVLRQTNRLVFVDSASTDDSVRIAKDLGVPTLELDADARLSAARARNTGFDWLVRRYPDLRYVQFVDGDAELLPDWLAVGSRALDDDGRTAAVFGRLRERHPEASVYNRLCDMEWYTPIGEVDWAGGIAMLRVEAFRDAGGFDPTLIAGEEPDLCARLQQNGWTIWCIDDPMALHDAAMSRLGQWWQRNVRAGHAYAEAVARRPREPAMDAGRQLRSIAFWGIGVPAAALSLAVPTLGQSVAWSAAGYLTLFFRVRRASLRRGFTRANADLYSAFCVLGKLPQAEGALRYAALSVRGRASPIIEHRNRK